jgi:hypothetical protein
MNDEERNSVLNFQRDKIIEELLIAPLRNDRFSASFIKTSLYSGEAIFKDNHNENVKTATWTTSKTTETIIVSLFDKNGFLIFEEDYDKFIDRVHRTIVM